jgi:type IV pilus assembly protein PilB
MSSTVPSCVLVDALLEQAINDRASDLHIEPSEDRVRLRVRVDGVLHDLSEAPLNLLRPVISRLKVLAELDITQTRIPQDGRFSISHKGFEVDVRIATLPSAHGETMVLRILDNAVGIIALPALGFRPAELQRYEPTFRAPQGAIMVSGPTGSGKSSTLYSTLAEINTRSDRSFRSKTPSSISSKGSSRFRSTRPRD